MKTEEEVPGTFLVAEIDWDTLPRQRQRQLLGRCGFSGDFWLCDWEDIEDEERVLLARELEAVSGGYVTLRHDADMEELRHKTGWEITCDPRCRVDDQSAH